jgi:hypothetical protein
MVEAGIFDVAVVQRAEIKKNPESVFFFLPKLNQNRYGNVTSQMVPNPAPSSSWLPYSKT